MDNRHYARNCTEPAGGQHDWGSRRAENDHRDVLKSCAASTKNRPMESRLIAAAATAIAMSQRVLEFCG
jgi:hypothetical protein